MSEQIGGNRPPEPTAPLTGEQIKAYLDYVMDSSIHRRKELLAALEHTAFTLVEIADDEHLAAIGDQMKQVNGLRKKVDADRTTYKAPYLDGGRVVDVYFKAFLAPLDGPVQKIMGAVNAYQRAKEEKARQAREEAARQAREEAARKAAQAARELAANPASERAGTMLEQAEIAAAQAAAASDRVEGGRTTDARVYSDLGTTVATRRTWSYEYDIAVLVKEIAAGRAPLSLIEINAAGMRALAQNRDPTGKPTAVVRGITWVAKDDTSFR
jgi:hypothetical protein